jgi:hypothetical protein
MKKTIKKPAKKATKKTVKKTAKKLTTKERCQNRVNAMLRDFNALAITEALAKSIDNGNMYGWGPDKALTPTDTLDFSTRGSLMEGLNATLALVNANENGRASIQITFNP